MDLKENLIRMAMQDMRRSLNRLPPPPDETTKSAIIVTNTSHEVWNKFYPPLTMIPEDDEQGIKLVSMWDREDKNVSENPDRPYIRPVWTLRWWCAVNRDNARITNLVTMPFGEAIDVRQLHPDEIVPAPTQFEFEN